METKKDLKKVDYKVRVDEFNRIEVKYTDENGKDFASVAPMGLLGNKTETVQKLCEILGIEV